MAVYEWALQFNRSQGLSINVEGLSPEDAHHELESVRERTGDLSKESIVEAATNRRSKLHKVFNWNDAEAAHAYRIEQAGLLMRSLKVTIKIDDEHSVKTRVWESIKNPENNTRVYIQTTEAMKDQVSRDDLLMQALNQLRAWRKKWHTLNELSDAIGIVDTAVETVQHQLAKTM